MKEIFYKRDEVKTLQELMVRSVNLFGNNTAIMFKEKRDIHSKTYMQLRQDIENFSSFLHVQG